MKKFIVPSSWSRKAIGSILVAAIACMVACGDDSSSSIGPNDEPLSVESSSSSKKLNSSSSVIASETKQSSSSSAKSSSSSIQKNSSSSEKTKSSSSKNEKETKVSSSSVKSSSSSSVILSASEESSSSSVKSSSSLVAPISSSSLQGDKLSSSSSKKQPESSCGSVEEPPTSSETESSSSSSEDKVNCSVLLEGETGWSWDVPKECRFNPDINYDTMTDERDGKTYRTVKIGDQTWMAENLNYYDATNLSVKEKSWCFGKKDNEDSTTCDVAGRFYTWAAAIDSVKLANDADNPQDCGYGKICTLPDTVYGICPPGWHLPDTTEWYTLFTVVGGRPTAGKALKSLNGWNDDDGVSGNGSDAFGFSALPVGARDGDLDGRYTTFWCASQFDRVVAYFMNLGVYERTYLYESWKYFAQSIRCVKNAE